MVYQVEAAQNHHDSILADHREAKDPDRISRFNVGPLIAQDWTPPTLIYRKGSKKVRPNFMDYDQGMAYAIDAEAIEKLALQEAEWCRLIPVRAEALDLRFKPLGSVEFTLLAVTRIVDAVDRVRTRFKPYGEEVFAVGDPDLTYFYWDRLPVDGLFHHKDGASTRILTYDDETRNEASFKRIFEASGLTGLRFIPLGNV
jgi:hypothetical protein